MVKTIKDYPMSELKNMNNIYVMNQGKPVSLLFSHNEIIDEIGRRERNEPATESDNLKLIKDFQSNITLWHSLLDMDISNLTYEQSMSRQEQMDALEFRIIGDLRIIHYRTMLNHVSRNDIQSALTITFNYMDILRRKL